MRMMSALLLVMLSASPAMAQQYQAKPLPQQLAKPKQFVIADLVARPAKPLADLLASCATCQTIATPTGSFQMIPNGNGQMTIRQSTGNPFGVPPCPTGLDAAQTTAMKARLTSLLNAATVKALEDGAAKEACPNVALALTFTQIVLGDDISITKAKP